MMSLLFFLLLPLLFFGCDGNNLNLKLKVHPDQRIEKGNKVYWDDRSVGEIEKVSPLNEAKILASIRIKKDAASGITKNCKLIVIDDPQDNTKRAIEITETSPDGLPLKDGMIFEAPYGYTDKFRLDFSRGVKNLKRKAEEYANELSKVPEKEDYKELESKFMEYMAELKQSAKEINNEVLYKLQELLDKLNKELKRLKNKAQDQSKKI